MRFDRGKSFTLTGVTAFTVYLAITARGIVYGQGGPGDPSHFPCDYQEAILDHYFTSYSAYGGEVYSKFQFTCAPENVPYNPHWCYWCVQAKWDTSFNGSTNWIALEQREINESDFCNETSTFLDFDDDYYPYYPNINVLLPSGTYRHTVKVYRGNCSGISTGTPILEHSITFLRP